MALSKVMNLFTVVAGSVADLVADRVNGIISKKCKLCKASE